MGGCGGVGNNNYELTEKNGSQNVYIGLKKKKKIHGLSHAIWDINILNRLPSKRR